jgi:hypothetical protein
MDAGLTDAEIMDRGGWKTEGMMRRYRKQSPERAPALSRKFAEHLRRLADQRAANADKVAVFPK